MAFLLCGFPVIEVGPFEVLKPRAAADESQVTIPEPWQVEKLASQASDVELQRGPFNPH